MKGEAIARVRRQQMVAERNRTLFRMEAEQERHDEWVRDYWRRQMEPEQKKRYDLGGYVMLPQPEPRPWWKFW